MLPTHTVSKIFILLLLLACVFFPLPVLQLVGGAIFGIVLWLRLDFWTTEYLELDSRLDTYLILLYIALAAGAVISGLSIIGLIGACLKNKVLIILV